MSKTGKALYTPIQALDELLGAEQMDIDLCRDVLTQAGLLVSDYRDYMIGEPMIVEQELQRLPDSDFELSRALLTLVVRDAEKAPEAFAQRLESGVFHRILAHTKDTLLEFRPEIRKIRLITPMGGWGPAPEPDEEIEQRLTITRNGQVWFSAYAFGDPGADRRYPLSRKMTTTIMRSDAELILDALGTYMVNAEPAPLVTDISSWSLEATAQDGSALCYSAPTCCSPEIEVEGYPVEMFMRRTLPIHLLHLFSGE